MIILNKKEFLSELKAWKKTQKFQFHVATDFFYYEKKKYKMIDYLKFYSYKFFYSVPPFFITYLPCSFLYNFVFDHLTYDIDKRLPFYKKLFAFILALPQLIFHGLVCLLLFGIGLTPGFIIHGGCFLLIFYYLFY